jgi:hypothetical protein
VPVPASKKQEYIPFPGELVRVPRKISERDGEAHAFGIRDAAVSAVAPVKKHRLLIALPPRNRKNEKRQIFDHALLVEERGHPTQWVKAAAYWTDSANGSRVTWQVNFMLAAQA